MMVMMMIPFHQMMWPMVLGWVFNISLDSSWSNIDPLEDPNMEACDAEYFQHRKFWCCFITQNTFNTVLNGSQSSRLYDAYIDYFLSNMGQNLALLWYSTLVAGKAWNLFNAPSGYVLEYRGMSCPENAHVICELVVSDSLHIWFLENDCMLVA